MYSNRVIKKTKFSSIHENPPLSSPFVLYSGLLQWFIFKFHFLNKYKGLLTFSFLQSYPYKETHTHTHIHTHTNAQFLGKIGSSSCFRAVFGAQHSTFGLK